MKVLVIGAAGKSGERVVERARAAGHTVTAFVHDPGSYHAPAGVRVVGGDAKDPATVGDAVAGQDAVIDTVGGRTPYVETDLDRAVAEAVVAGMRRHGVRRLVVISAVGVGDSKEQATFVYRRLLMPTFLRGAMKDKEAMEAEVKASGLDFVLVRPPALTDGEPTGKVQVVGDDETAHGITRADLATFLVEQLTSNAHVGTAVTVANG